MALTDYLETPLRLGAPDVAGALAVFPVFGDEPRLPYRSFAQAAPLGVVVTEIAGTASVADRTFDCRCSSPPAPSSRCP
jgi:hypothetical protein